MVHTETWCLTGMSDSVSQWTQEYDNVVEGGADTLYTPAPTTTTTTPQPLLFLGVVGQKFEPLDKFEILKTSFH